MFYSQADFHSRNPSLYGSHQLISKPSPTIDQMAVKFVKSATQTGNRLFALKVKVAPFKTCQFHEHSPFPVCVALFQFSLLLSSQLALSAEKFDVCHANHGQQKQSQEGFLMRYRLCDQVHLATDSNLQETLASESGIHIFFLLTRSFKGIADKCLGLCD